MKSKIKLPIIILPYPKVNFRWINNFYDIKLNGTCKYNNKLCEFKTIVGDYNEEKEEWNESTVEIYNLNIIENIKWRLRQFMFEQCVGYHWTIGKKVNFHIRKPQFLYKLLLNLYYYKSKKNIKTKKI